MPKNFSTPLSLSRTPFKVPFAMWTEAYAAVLKIQSDIINCGREANMFMNEVSVHRFNRIKRACVFGYTWPKTSFYSANICRYARVPMFSTWTALGPSHSLHFDTRYSPRHRVLLNMIRKPTGGGSRRARMPLRTWKWECGKVRFSHMSLIDVDSPPNVETTGLTSSRGQVGLHLDHDQRRKRRNRLLLAAKISSDLG